MLYVVQLVNSKWIKYLQYHSTLRIHELLPLMKTVNYSLF